MFLVRLLVLGVFVVMLLPTDPASRPYHASSDRAGFHNFCDRYPKTCDASGELWAAFKRKLIYGIKLARQSLAAEAEKLETRYGESKLGGRLGEWRQPPPIVSDHAQGTLSPGERSPNWYRDDG